MIDILVILSFYGLTFFLKESEIFAPIRSRLIANKYLGVFFYGLFSCAFCLGCHSGYIICFIKNGFIINKDVIFYILGSATVSLLFDRILAKLENNPTY